jgi:hypothetical protein
VLVQKFEQTSFRDILITIKHGDGQGVALGLET